MQVLQLLGLSAGPSTQGITYSHCTFDSRLGLGLGLSLFALVAGSVKRNVLIAGNAGHVGFSFLCKLHEAVLITRSPAYPRDKTF